MAKSFDKKNLYRKNNSAVPSEYNDFWLAKYLARAGLSSRRQAIEIIKQGDIYINKTKILDPATKVSSGDLIYYQNKPVLPPEDSRIWLYHKPRRIIVSDRDEKSRKCLADVLSEHSLNYQGHIKPIGRLDYNSEGLILLTNDGELAKKLCAPDSNIIREYQVRVRGKISQTQLDKLSDGITIDKISYRPIEARIISSKNSENNNSSNLWLYFKLTEGKNQEIRKICAYFGLQVSRLVRISFAGWEIGNLPKGKIIEVSL